MKQASSRARRALLLDIGNTRVKWAAVDVSGFIPDAAFERVHAATHAQLESHEAMLDDAGDIERVICSNVGPASIEDALHAHVMRMRPDVAWTSVVPTHEAGGVVNGYRDPARLGADRWAALIGAHAMRPDHDLLVCGFGTATTIDLLRRADGPSASKARFEGGLILPGVDAMRRSLAHETARLPKSMRDIASDATDFAADTDDAITSGVIAAQAGAVERSWRIATARDDGHRWTCILAGGAASMIAPHLASMSSDTRAARIEVVPDLVLRGLAALAALR